MPFFCCDEYRDISMAQQMYYPAPCLHPDRVMTEHDLIYMLEGEWEVWEEDQAYRMTPGDVLILSAGRHHFGKEDCTAGTRTLFAHIQALEGDLRPEDTALRGIHLPTFIHCQDTPGVFHCFIQLVDAFWAQNTNRSFRLSALLQLLLCELDAAANAGENQLHSLAVRAQSAFHMDPQGKITTEQLAQTLGVTARRLRYAFEQEMGLPPYRYHLNVRLDMAMKILQNEPERTLRDLAEAYGFYDEFHFSRTFKHRFGIPPSQVAKMASRSPREE